MSRSSVLENGDTFPSLELKLAGGGSLSLPDDLAGSFGVVLVYRGAWCPYCNAQLSGFARAKEQLDALGVAVVALSVDDEETTLALIEKRKLNYPVAYGANVAEVAERTGAFVNTEPSHLQSTGFVLAPDGTIVTMVYASGPIGRLVAEDVVGLVRYVKEHNA